MKKFLLLTVASCMSMASYAADAQWTASVNGIFESDPIYSGNVITRDAAGNTYVAGQYDKEEISINGTTYEGIGKSAYVVKYDASGAPQWTITFKGAATVTAMTVDNAKVPYIYIAGTFADEVELGNNEGFDPETIYGAKDAFDSYFSDQASAFIAKYRATDGCLSQTTTFLPEELADAINLGGDAFFRINHINVVEDKVYATAVYGGLTKNGEAEFNGYSKYDPEWFCTLYGKAASLFSLSLGLRECTNMISCGPGKDLGESDVACNATDVAMLVNDEYNIYAAFSAYGPVVIKEENASDKKAECEEGVVSYIFRKLGGQASKSFIVLDNEDIDGYQPFGIAALTIDGGNLLAQTYQTAETGEGDNTQTERQTSVYSLKTTAFKTNSVTSSKAYSAGDADYSIINKAEYIKGSWFCTLIGVNKGGNTVGYKTGILKDANFTPAPVADAVTFAADETSSVYANVTSEGVTYSQYATEFAGISDITVDNANAPVEYYNIQGIRIDNPTNGIYIRRQGTNVSKVLVK